MSIIPLPMISRILLVRRDNIGDLVCTTPAIAALRERYPSCEIAVLANSYNAEVLRGNPCLDKVFIYKKLKHAKGVLGRVVALVNRFRLNKELRKWNADVTILAKSNYDRHGLNMAKQFGARNIIGYGILDPAHKCLLPDICLKAPDFESLHEVQAVCALLEPLGINSASGPLQVFPDFEVVSKLKQNIPVASVRVALHISAREVQRRWGLEKFTTLSRYVLDKYPDVQILLFWAPGDAKDPHHPGDDEDALSLIGTLDSPRLVPMRTKNLTELIAAIALCDIFVGTDGGAMHLAVGLGKKVIALFENLPGKLKHWYPWQGINHVIHSQNPVCTEVSAIKERQVIEALRDLLG